MDICAYRICLQREVRLAGKVEFADETHFHSLVIEVDKTDFFLTSY